jgi:hypothetical protein
MHRLTPGGGLLWFSHSGNLVHFLWRSLWTGCHFLLKISVLVRASVTSWAADYFVQATCEPRDSSEYGGEHKSASTPECVEVPSTLHCVLHTCCRRIETKSGSTRNKRCRVGTSGRIEGLCRTMPEELQCRDEPSDTILGDEILTRRSNLV